MMTYMTSPQMGGRIELGCIGDLLGEMAADLERMRRERVHFKMCVAAGKDEPDRSPFRSAWGSIGFYLPPKKGVKMTTTWRR